MDNRLFGAAAFAIASTAIVACSRPSPFGSAQGDAWVPVAGNAIALTSPLVTGAGKIKHVVYIVQENRSFDDMFEGYPGADTVTSGKNSHGKTITLQPISLKTRYDIDHGATGMFAACDGTGKLPGTHCRMDGFNQEGEYDGPVDGQYVYVPHGESKPYFDMAHEFVLADRMFASQLDESFVAHQYIIAAQANSSVNVPTVHGAAKAARPIPSRRSRSAQVRQIAAPLLRL